MLELQEDRAAPHRVNTLIALRWWQALPGKTRLRPQPDWPFCSTQMLRLDGTRTYVWRHPGTGRRSKKLQAKPVEASPTRPADAGGWRDAGLAGTGVEERQKGDGRWSDPKAVGRGRL